MGKEGTFCNLLRNGPTMVEMQEFYVTQILREINFGELKAAERKFKL